MQSSAFLEFYIQNFVKFTLNFGNSCQPLLNNTSLFVGSFENSDLSTLADASLTTLMESFESLLDVHSKMSEINNNIYSSVDSFHQAREVYKKKDDCLKTVFDDYAFVIDQVKLNADYIQERVSDQTAILKSQADLLRRERKRRANRPLSELDNLPTV